MNKTVITNTTFRSLFVGGRMLPPGCSMECEPHEVPAGLKTAFPFPSQHSEGTPTSGDLDPLFTPEDFLKQSLRDMEDNGLNELEPDQLTELRKLEEAGQNRQTVLSAIDAAKLKQAQK